MLVTGDAEKESVEVVVVDNGSKDGSAELLAKIDAAGGCRLIAACDIRIGDMRALPWAPASFDVVTSFRGIWGTTPEVVAELRRVLRPGGSVGITVWGHLKVSPGVWSMAPFRLAAVDKVDNQAAMVSLGRPGAGERLLESYGFVAAGSALRLGVRGPGAVREGAGLNRPGL